MKLGTSLIALALLTTPASAAVSEKWRSASAHIAREMQEARDCSTHCSSVGMMELHTVLEHARSLWGKNRIEYVNQVVNAAIRYKDDPNDIWQSPKESFDLRTGDCEDYAIAKYALLREAGVPSEDIRVVIGSTRKYDHAIVTVKVDSDTFVLNNQNNIVPKFEDLLPFFTPILFMSIEHGVEVK